MFNHNTKRQFQKLIYNSFSSREIRHLGEWVHKAFNLERLADFPKGVEIPRSTAAEIIVEFIDQKGKLDKLMAYILPLDKFKGREIRLANLKPFLKSLNENGFQYNRDSGRIEGYNTEGRGWGILIPDRQYFITCVNIDIIASSKLVHDFNRDLVEATLRNFREYVFRRIRKYDGRVWEWLGDGGLAVFLNRENLNEAVLCTINILMNIVIFNSLANRLPKDIEIRAGIHCGTITYSNNYAEIRGDAKEYAVKIQKEYSKTNELTISELVMNDLEPNIKKQFYASYSSKMGKLYKFQCEIGQLEQEHIFV